MSLEIKLSVAGNPQGLEAFIEGDHTLSIALNFDNTELQGIWREWTHQGLVDVKIQATIDDLFPPLTDKPADFVYQTKQGTFVRRERIKSLCIALGMTSYSYVAHALTAMTSFGIPRHSPPDYFAKIAPIREDDINLTMLLWAAENPHFQQDVYRCYGAGERNFRDLAIFISKVRGSGISQPSS